MRRRLSIISLVALIVLMLAVIALSAGSTYLEVKLLPIIIAGIVILLAAIQLWREASGKKIVLDDVRPETMNTRRYFAESVWILGFLVAIYVIGFLVAIPVFIVWYLRGHDRPWRTSVILAIVVTVFIYAVFTILLGMKIYPGKLFELIW